MYPSGNSIRNFSTSSSWRDSSAAVQAPASDRTKTHYASVNDDFITVVAQISSVVLSTRGGISLEQTQQYLNGLDTLGQGATFNVKAVKRMGGRQLPWEASSAEFREDLVYKRLRRFPPVSAAQRAQQLQSIILEIQVLSYPPLREHENIVNLVGLGFEPCFYGSPDPWPVLLLERAQYGTLADLQQRNQSLSTQAKLELSLDIAFGLYAIHQNGIVHGDVKSENILIFQHDEREYVAKVADFGFAMLSERTCAVRPQGTFPWQAPEVLSRQYLSTGDMALGDV